MSFYCDHCGFQDNEVQPATEIQEQGAKHVLRLTHDSDLQRQIVKSDSAILRIEEHDIEIPAGRGRLTNVEGVITDVITGLESGQKQRKKNEPEAFQKIDSLVQNLIKMTYGAKFPFTISIDDPAGNSSIEPLPNDAETNDKLIHKRYPRTPLQNAALGFGGGEEPGREVKEIVPQVGEDGGDGMEDVDILEGQTYDLPVECPGCTRPAHMLLQMVNIPHFKQVVLSTTQCESCNYRTADVKTGGEVPEKGKRIYLIVKGPDDLSRDILKSETCLFKIPECKLEVEPGSLGGRFTTVEGLITDVRDDLKGSIFGDSDEDSTADSMDAEKKTAWLAFFSQIDKAIAGETEFTVIMEDPLAASYCQELAEPGEDPNVRSEEYERTEEEEEHLGLKDMKTQLGESGEYVRHATMKSVAAEENVI